MIKSSEENAPLSTSNRLQSTVLYKIRKLVDLESYSSCFPFKRNQFTVLVSIQKVIELCIENLNNVIRIILLKVTTCSSSTSNQSFV